MTYRVIQWGTGNTGKTAVQGIAAHPDLELVGTWVHSKAKDGVDVGEICGLSPIGVTATRDKEALLAMPADCVSFMPARTWAGDNAQTLEDLLAILRSGKNVANLWWPALVNPKAVGEEIHRKLQDACLEGGSSLYTAGMNPGFGTLGLILAGFNLSSSVHAVRCNEFFNYSHWAEPTINLYFGFGQPDPAKVPIIQPGFATRLHASTLHMMAEAIGVEINEIVEEPRVIYADERFNVASGPIEKGTISGVAYDIKGMVKGEPRVAIGHVARLRDEDFGEEAFRGEGYRAEIDGDPMMRVDVQISSPAGAAHDHGVGVSTSMSVINAIPEICEAAPGVVRILDLSLSSRRF